MKKVDVLFSYLTFLYLSVPVLIFFVGWLRTGLALPLSFVLIWGVWRYLSRLEYSVRSPRSINRPQLLLTAGLAFLWVYLSGIGGFANQDWDHHFRNALFRDLVTRPWPVYYTFPAGYRIEALANHHSALNYYVTFWLPAAQVGKWLGPQAANVGLLAWSYIGIVLVLYYLNRLFDFRYPAFVSLFFMLWSGLDILGKLVIQRHLVYPGEPIELYYSYFYTAFTTDLFNPFNQVIPTWLLTSWVLNYRRTLHLLPISFLFAYAPFPFMGLSLFYGIQYLIDSVSRGRTGTAFWGDVLRAFGKAETLAGVCLLAVYALLYQAHTSEVPSSLFWTRYVNGDALRKLKTSVSYFITFFLEAGVYFGLIVLLSRTVYRTYKRQFWLSFGLLLLIPVWVIGQYNDFASRGSIPCLLVLCVMTAKAIIDRYDSGPNRSVLVLPALTLLVAWITPAILIVKSIPADSHPKLKDSVGTFADPQVSKQNDKEELYASIHNFYSHEPQGYFFYRYMAKR